MLRMRFITSLLRRPISRPSGLPVHRALRCESLENRLVLASQLGDFNGDGFDDLAIGAPNEDIFDVVDAGLVTIIDGSALGLAERNSRVLDENVIGQATRTASATEFGDHFGAVLATGDFDADGFADLAIGTPGEDEAGADDAGAVTVLYGSSSGFDWSKSQFFSQRGLSAAGGANSFSEPYDGFGSALAVGDFNGDQFDDLAVGVPGDDIVSVVDQGSVTIINGSTGGLQAHTSETINQATLRLSGGANSPSEVGDGFGFSLAVGDFNGDRFDDLAVGTPGEDVGSHVDTGEVTVIGGSATGPECDR